MNTTIAKTVFAATVIAAVAAAAALAGFAAQRDAAPKQAIVKLERVVIVAKRAPAEVQVARRIETLPRVVIEGRRAETTLVARAERCAAPVLC